MIAVGIDIGMGRRARQLVLKGLFDVLMDKPMIAEYIDLSILPIAADYDVAPKGSAGRQANQLVACMLEYVGNAKQIFPALHCQEAVNARRLGAALHRVPRCFDHLMDTSALQKINNCEAGNHADRLLKASRWGLPNAPDATTLPWVVVDQQPLPCKDGRCELLKPICDQLAAKHVHLTACLDSHSPKEQHHPLHSIQTHTNFGR
jgi:hypothetical protein